MSLPAETARQTLALDALHRLLEGQALGDSERQRQLLRYLVSEELDGRGAEIKATRIAIDVFGRGAEFDPQTDSIVRTEVGRLRKALLLHYATVGKGDRVRFEIPVGAYRPAVTIDERDGRTGEPPTRRRDIRWVVATLVAVGALVGFFILHFGHAPTPRQTLSIGILRPAIGALDQSQGFIQAGIRGEFVALLSRSPELTVVPLDSEPAPRSPLQVDFIVRSSIQIAGGRALVQLLLVDGKARNVLAEERHQTMLNAADVFELQSYLAERLAILVGRPFGLVATQAMRSGRPGSLGEIHCYFQALRYFDNFVPADRREAAECLQMVERQHPLMGKSRAALAYMDLLGNRYSADARPWQQALAAFSASTDEAARLEPSHWLTGSGQSTVALCNADVPRFRSLAEAAIARTPRNPALLADLGAKLVLGAGDVASGMRLVQEARALNDRPQAWYDLPALMIAIRDGQPFEARDLLLRHELAPMPEVWMLGLAAAHMLDDDSFQTLSLRRLQEGGIANQSAIVALLERSCWAAEAKNLVRPWLQGPGAFGE
jgi:adenylate cyclase